MWFALTKEMFAVAPAANEPFARLSIGEAEMRRVLRKTIWARSKAGSKESLLQGPPFDLRIKRADLYALEAVMPCPNVRVVFRSGGSPDDRVFALGTPSSARVCAQVVEALFESVAEQGYDTRLDRGWLEHPDVRWQFVDALPEDAPNRGAGAYRTAERDADVVARRPPSSGLEAMLIWLASGPETRFRHTPNEVVLTRTEVFVRYHGGRTACLPRDSLISARRNSDGDVLYRFGRYATLLLAHRDDCGVVAQLNAQLEAGATGSSA